MSEYNSQQMSYILETNPQEFLDYIQDKENRILVHRWLMNGSKIYHGWNSPPIQLLIWLTGTRARDSYEPKGIPEDIALEIFDEFAKYSLDKEDTDCDGNNIEQYIRNCTGSVEESTDNQRLIRRICEYFDIPMKEEVAPCPVASSSNQFPPEEEPNYGNNDNDNREIDLELDLDIDSWIYNPNPQAHFTPPTYDGHLQNFIDNIDEYEYECGLE